LIRVISEIARLAFVAINLICSFSLIEFAFRARREVLAARYACIRAAVVVLVDGTILLAFSVILITDDVRMSTVIADNLLVDHGTVIAIGSA
jgi:hypothetical protein